MGDMTKMIQESMAESISGANPRTAGYSQKKGYCLITERNRWEGKNGRKENESQMWDEVALLRSLWKKEDSVSVWDP